MKILKVLKSTKVSKCILFLEEYKHYAGLGDWSILFSVKKSLEEGNLAECEPVVLEKKLKVLISEVTLNGPEKELCNILFHELLHARLDICQKRIEVLSEHEEEVMINDITRGVERLVNGFKFKC